MAGFFLWIPEALTLLTLHEEQCPTITSGHLRHDNMAEVASKKALPRLKTFQFKKTKEREDLDKGKVK